jgi:glucose-6-phosphate 1-dehydrogenase
MQGSGGCRFASLPGDATVIEHLVLFGATGDLAGRYLFPALAALLDAGELPEGFAVTGAARENLDDESFRLSVQEALAAHADHVPEAARRRLLGSLSYRAVDVGDAASVASLVSGAESPVAAYLALPPQVFPPAVRALGGADLPDGSRIVLEKPFGTDLDSAVSLNRLLADVTGEAGEKAVFRVDHVLGMENAQNLLTLRRNRVLDAVWNGAHVEQVEILWEETLALEGRAGYFDGAGALKDVLQNHMLQVLCLVAMEPPGSADEEELRDRKVEVLRSARAVSSRRARYSAGRLAVPSGAGETSVPDYAEEDGVDPARQTETFCEVTLELDSDHWRNTRFVLRAGKALRRTRKGVVLHFRADPGGGTPNELWIGVDGPNDMVLRLSGNSFGKSEQLELSGEPPAAALPAYARVLLDVLTGGCALSVRGDEAEWSWRVVTPVLEDWRAGRVPLEEYPAGSDGPVG